MLSSALFLSVPDQVMYGNYVATTFRAISDDTGESVLMYS